MLRARLSDGAFVLGLDAENVQRLREGKPISVNLAQLGGADHIYIVYGETVEAIARELQEAAGSPLPIPKPLPTGH